MGDSFKLRGVPQINVLRRIRIAVTQRVNGFGEHRQFAPRATRLGSQVALEFSGHRKGFERQPCRTAARLGNALSEEVICALLRDFWQHGQKAVAKVRRTQPAAYLNTLALLVQTSGLAGAGSERGPTNDRERARVAAHELLNRPLKKQVLLSKCSRTTAGTDHSSGFGLPPTNDP